MDIADLFHRTEFGEKPVDYTGEEVSNVCNAITEYTGSAATGYSPSTAGTSSSTDTSSAEENYI